MGPTTLERHFVLWFKLATGGDKSGHKAPRFLAGAVIAQCKTHCTNGTFGFSNTHSQHKTKRAIISNTLQYNSKKIINFDHNWTSTNSGNDTRAKNKRIKATSWS